MFIEERNSHFAKPVLSAAAVKLSKAKIRVIDYYDYALNVDIDDIEDEIHNYYSQLN